MLVTGASSGIGAAVARADAAANALGGLDALVNAVGEGLRLEVAVHEYALTSVDQ